MSVPSADVDHAGGDRDRRAASSSRRRCTRDRTGCGTRRSRALACRPVRWRTGRGWSSRRRARRRRASRARPRRRVASGVYANARTPRGGRHARDVDVVLHRERDTGERQRRAVGHRVVDSRRHRPGASSSRHEVSPRVELGTRSTGDRSRSRPRSSCRRRPRSVSRHRPPARASGARRHDLSRRDTTPGDGASTGAARSSRASSPPWTRADAGPDHVALRRRRPATRSRASTPHRRRACSGNGPPRRRHADSRRRR